MTPEIFDAVTTMVLKIGGSGVALVGSIWLIGKYLDLRIAKAKAKE